MFNNELIWFFTTFSAEFRKNKTEVFQTVMFLSLAHFFGFYNPCQLADYIGVSKQELYRKLKELSLYQIKEIQLCFMVKQAAERLNQLSGKSAATLSRAAVTLSVDNSVIDRFGRMLRCTYTWYSGRWKKTLNGHDLLGIVLTVGGTAIPLSLLFCSKQGRANTSKPTLLISMLTRLKEEFRKEGIDITAYPITLDSWFVSEDLRKKLILLGFKKIILAGKGNYTFNIKTGKENKKMKASEWKKHFKLKAGEWGINVPSVRVKAKSPTFGEVVLFFYKKSSTRNYYLIDFSEKPGRGAEIWNIWKQHHIIECFWRLIKSTFQIKSMRLQGDGLYVGLLIKLLSYLLVSRLQFLPEFAKLSMEQVMRKIRREYDLEALMEEHFHAVVSAL